MFKRLVNISSFGDQMLIILDDVGQFDSAVGQISLTLFLPITWLCYLNTLQDSIRFIAKLVARTYRNL